ncbi:outer membrane beta-barrel protein [Dyadobacter pollutisoli]|jgi:hypothetical protein|uniref:Outer membrane beta-barrel protein n=1 Tax=Dyadobacter pollutisoli TaxID=2910158 RepID=A0A9E8N8S8_9BACT|nr:outer membrane beta-barrel protein [Dyadobacter pollutisoli]WAC10858.1 outer membrane beta-barrel protein [Dyadobacter pollutisoli]
MDPSEINNFEDQWRKAFKEASETPPQSVWEGIEARLDEGNKRGVILPLWWQSSKVWYAAASIAAILMVGGGIWYNNNSGVKNDAANTGIAATHHAEKAVTEKEVLPETKTNAPEVISENAQLAKNSAGNKAIENKVTKQDVEIAHQGKSQNANSIAAKLKGNAASQSAAAVADQKLAVTRSAGENVKVSDKSFADQKALNPAADQILPNQAKIASNENVSAKATQQSNIAAESLAALPYSDLDVHVQKRYVFFRPDIKSEEPVKLSKQKEYWAGLNLMPASFNPDLKLKEAPMAFANQSVANKKSVSGESESGVSYAVQTQGGMRLSKHWSVELGVSYLKGNSDYIGGGYVLSAYNSQSSNVLEDALAGLAASPNPGSDKSAGFVNNGALYIDVAKKVSNNYQYLQLPVQAGFTVNPDKKLSYSVLGGMSANFFLTNELESASGEIITTTANDEIYRTTNWSATTGLRLNYKLSTKWKASLTGSYQKAITSGFRSNQSLESHPYLYGVAWGVRYSF